MTCVYEVARARGGTRATVPQPAATTGQDARTRARPGRDEGRPAAEAVHVLAEGPRVLAARSATPRLPEQGARATVAALAAPPHRPTTDPR